MVPLFFVSQIVILDLRRIAPVRRIARRLARSFHRISTILGEASGKYGGPSRKRHYQLGEHKYNSI